MFRLEYSADDGRTWTHGQEHETYIVLLRVAREQAVLRRQRTRIWNTDSGSLLVTIGVDGLPRGEEWTRNPAG